MRDQVNFNLDTSKSPDFPPPPPAYSPQLYLSERWLTLYSQQSLSMFKGCFVEDSLKVSSS